MAINLNAALFNKKADMNSATRVKKSGKAKDSEDGLPISTILEQMTKHTKYGKHTIIENKSEVGQEFAKLFCCGNGGQPRVGANWEFQKVLGLPRGTELTEENIRPALERLDTNNDGRISSNETAEGRAEALAEHDAKHKPKTLAFA